MAEVGGALGWRGVGARVSEFFIQRVQEAKSKKYLYWGLGVRGSEFFLTENPTLKKNFFFFLGGGGGGGGAERRGGGVGG